MPELPEVETTRRGIESHISDRRVVDVVIRHHQLRYPVPGNLPQKLIGHSIDAVERRGKYLLFRVQRGTMIIHLGMSGSLCLVNRDKTVNKHDHVDIVFDNDTSLRLHDPRRFGAVLWCDNDPGKHALLAHLGPEPLTRLFNGRYLYERSRGRKQTVKQFVMDSKIVVGVGNIYASEALFLAGIRPTLAAGKLTLERCNLLVAAIKKVLRAAIKQGGTTLRDFVNGAGKPGYFQQKLNVYGRDGESCRQCGTVIKQIRLGQRATYYCSTCQHSR